MAKKETKTIIEKIYDYTLEDIMGDRFGRYSKSIIQDRALPDVRDGLKPVQRRILYTMWENKNTFDKPYRKCAKAVGDVMGKYHPHGDSSIYGAMINMSQNWKMRELFIDIHGNNGSIDGDGPAAYRYTETRLTKLAGVMLKDIDHDAVLMTLNYSDEDLEPTVLPANFPNLLVNGSTGISAGYATNIPPHNLAEVIDATIYRIDNPNSRLDTILNIVKGPDFPTGGVVLGIAGLRQAYETGRGKITVRAKTRIVNEKGKNQIIIEEIPYDVLKEGLRKKIEDIKIDKKVDGITDVRDESDKEHLARIVIDLKKEANSELILNYLLKNTDLQVNYNFNMVAICDRRPKQLGLLEILDAFILHQKDVVLRKTRYHLDHALERLEIVNGLLKAVDILDEIIKTIRKSLNRSDSIKNLIDKFEFTERQATAIVDMKLYRLSNTDVEALKQEFDNLNRTIELLKTILNDETILKKQMKSELNEIKKEYKSERRTEISELDEEIKLDMTEMIPKENVMVFVSNEGYVKRVSIKSVKACEGEETTLKPGDYIIGKFNCNTLDKILLFTNLGNYLFVPVHTIFESKFKDLGKHISNLISIAPDEKIIGAMMYKETNENIIFITKNGMIKRSNINEFVVSRNSKPITCMKLKAGDELISATLDLGNVLLVTQNGYYLHYSAKEVPVVGKTASGVKGISLKDDIVVAGLCYDNTHEYLDIITDKKTAKRIRLADLDLMNRAKRGGTLIKKVKSNPYNILNAFVTNTHDTICIKCVSEIDEIKNSDIPIMDLASTGSAISKYDIDEAFVKADEIIFKSEEVKVVEEEPVKEEEVVNLSIDDFIDDFKL